MQSSDLKAIRKKLGMSQASFAEALGVSRVLVNQMEGGAAISERSALEAQKLAGQVRLIYDRYVVEQADLTGEYVVIRRTLKERSSPYAMYSGHSSVLLYGKFKRRDHAYRWAAALILADDPRNTRLLIRERKEDKEVCTADAGG